MSHDRADAPRADILIVDDTRANLRLLSKMLAEQGYQVRPVPDGALALAAARAEPPDLILLDIRMPEMSGYQVCERLKADARTRDVPIIFISALDATQDKVSAFAVGGVDYVTKPFQNEEVLARVATHLALRRLQESMEEGDMPLETLLARYEEGTRLVKACQGKLTDAELDEYRRPFRNPGEDRRPTLTWPRELPIEGEPADVLEIIERNSAWLGGTPIPKLFINAEPGAVLVGRHREICRGWPNQTEVTVRGLHYLHEDSPDEIGAAIREWYVARLR